MKHHSRLAAAGLAGLIAVGSLAATLATAAPAAAADFHGHERVAYHRDWHRRWAPAYPAPAVVYPAPAPVYVPAYPYAYPVPAGGYVHVGGPGWGVGIGF